MNLNSAQAFTLRSEAFSLDHLNLFQTIVIQDHSGYTDVRYYDEHI